MSHRDLAVSVDALSRPRAHTRLKTQRGEAVRLREGRKPRSLKHDALRRKTSIGAGTRRPKSVSKCRAREATPRRFYFLGGLGDAAVK
jgi:hypothetical protein